MVITAHVESLTENLEGLKGFFPEHWVELALNKDKVPLDPQYDIYLQRDAAGQVLYVALREGGNQIGYFVGFIAPGLHYKTCLTLTMDIFWVHPERRKGRGGIILFKEVEREAKRRGVHRMFMGSKLHKDAGALFQYLKYEPVETYFTKWIGD